MAKFEKPKKNQNGGEEPPPAPEQARIVEPKCLVCSHPERDKIDYLLAMRTRYKELERLFNIPYRSFSNHDKKHLDYKDASIREVIEYEAGIAGENLEYGVRGAFLRRSALDVSIKKFFDALTAGTIPIEAGDVIKMIELRERLDESTAAAQIEQYELQFNAFKEALEEICPPEMLVKILDKTRAKLQVSDRPALQPPEGQ